MPRVGGHATNSITLANLLCDLGFEVELSVVFSILANSHTVDPDRLRYLHDKGISVRLPPVWLRKIRFAQPIFHGIRYVFCKRGTDVFVVLGLERASLFLRSCIRPKSSVFYYIMHEPNSDRFGRFAKIARAFSLFAVVAPVTRDALRPLTDEATLRKVVPIFQFSEFRWNPIDRNREGPGDLSDRITALYLGRINAAKGILWLARQWRTEMGADCALRVYGDGPDQSVLEEIADNSGTSNDPSSASLVTYCGRFDISERDDALNRVFTDVDLLVLPTLDHPEGTPTVILEALCAGIPVVATDTGGTVSFSKQYFPDLPDGLVVCRPDDMFAEIRDLVERIRNGESFCSGLRSFYREHFSDEVLIEQWRRVFCGDIGCILETLCRPVNGTNRSIARQTRYPNPN